MFVLHGSLDLGVWLFFGTVHFRYYSHNCIDVEVGTPGSNEHWRFTGVYGFAANGDRMRTWNLLRSLESQASLPWLVAGDFNEILCNAEKSGGPPRGAIPMLNFRRALVDCGLKDLGFFGSKFTWCNRYTKERLDRACSTPSWSAMYPCSRVVTLPPNKYDHNPLLIEVKAEPFAQRRRSRRFRFEEMWAQHQDSTSVIQQGWTLPTTGDPMAQVCKKIHYTGALLMEWHLGVFQQRRTEMKLIQEKLDALMCAPFHSDQFAEQSVLRVRFNELLSLDEAYWRQRSRVLWLKDGDRNSVFFHRRASNRRSRNRFSGLMDENGVWCSKPSEYTGILTRYYDNIFKSEGSDFEAMEEVLQAVLPCVSSDMNDSLIAPYTDEEIKKALFQMHPSKSPGPDGMSPFFIKNIGMWCIMMFVLLLEIFCRLGVYFSGPILLI